MPPAFLTCWSHSAPLPLRKLCRANSILSAIEEKRELGLSVSAVVAAEEDDDEGVVVAAAGVSAALTTYRRPEVKPLISLDRLVRMHAEADGRRAQEHH